MGYSRREEAGIGARARWEAAPLSLIEKSAEIENCDRELRAALGKAKGQSLPATEEDR